MVYSVFLSCFSEPNRDELERVLRTEPFMLSLTRREWDVLLEMARPRIRSGGGGGGGGGGEGMFDDDPPGLLPVDVKIFFNNVHRTLKKYSGDVAWSGNQKNLIKETKKRARIKEMELRTKAPYSTRTF